MEANEMQVVVGLLKDIATVILPIIGVIVGARLARRAGDDQWLKKERLAAYLTLMDQFEQMLLKFSVGMKVSKFVSDAAEHGHDFEGVEQDWHEQMDDLKRAEVRIAILGGRLGSVYDSTAHDLIWEMLEAIESEEITEPEWAALTKRGHALQDVLVMSAKADLEVPVIRKKRGIGVNR